MAGIFDLFGGFGGAGSDPNSQLALSASDAARAQPAPATPSWGFGNPFQGNPVFGQQSQPDDAMIDPDTGASKGFTRRENNKAMLQTGLMLLAAGTSTDDSARAQIISGLPNVMDNSSRIQNYAKMRLELAKSKLADAQAQQAMKQDAAWNSFINGGSDSTPPAAPVSQPAAPSGAGMSAPGPMASAVGPSVVPAATAMASGTGNAADAAIMAAATSGAAAGVGAAPPQAPAPVPSAPPMPTPATSIIGGPGKVTLPSKAPDKMDIPPEIANFSPQNLSPQQRQVIAGMGREKGLAEFERLASEARNQEYPGSPIMMEGTNQIQVPMYKNGRLAYYKEAGAGTTSAKIVTDEQGNKSIQTFDARGNVTKIDPTELTSDKQQQAMQAADTAAAQTNAEGLKKQYAGLADAGQRYARASQAIDDIQKGNVNTGPVSGFMNYGKRLFDTFGQLSDEEKQKLLATDNAQGLEGSIVAKLAKANNGSQITDADVKFAQNIVTGGGSPDEVAAALKRYQQELRNEVGLYNDAANDHNSRIGGIRAGDYVKGGLKVKTIQGDFGTLGDANTPAYATPASGAQPAPNQPRTPLDMLGKAMGSNGSIPAPLAGAPAVTAPVAAPAAPVAGTVAKGYRFKGGDPSKQANWEKV